MNERTEGRKELCGCMVSQVVSSVLGGHVRAVSYALVAITSAITQQITAKKIDTYVRTYNIDQPGVTQNYKITKQTSYYMYIRGTSYTTRISEPVFSKKHAFIEVQTKLESKIVGLYKDSSRICHIYTCNIPVVEKSGMH